MMTKWIRKNWTMFTNTLGVLSLIVLCVWYISVVASLERKLEEPEPVVVYVYEPAPVEEKVEMFDTSSLLAWCGGGELGTVRMVGAWENADGQIVDEQSNVWEIAEKYEKNDLLLLWIADNGTVEDVADDVIVKVWREAYRE